MRRRVFRLWGLVAVFLVVSLPGQAGYVVRISDLGNDPKPANPVTTCGTVTADNPLTISDGRSAIKVTGLTASLGDFLVVTGDWNGISLAPVVPAHAFVGPARVEMIYVAAGSFLMGSSGLGDDALVNRSLEKPQHSVYVPGFWVGKYEVMRGEYRKFLTATGHAEPPYWTAAQADWGSGPFTQSEKHPVVGVTYSDAVAYCAWAGGRLPKEAEWEKAARWDGHPRVYPWGDVWDVEKCNTYRDTNPAGGGDYRQQTAPVGSYPAGASPYGCQDMAGNAWEWCADWWVSYPGASQSHDYTNLYRVLRGGGWYYVQYYNRCECRDTYSIPDTSWCDLGFRMAR